MGFNSPTTQLGCPGIGTSDSASALRTPAHAGLSIFLPSTARLRNWREAKNGV